MCVFQLKKEISSIWFSIHALERTSSNYIQYIRENCRCLISSYGFLFYFRCSTLLFSQRFLFSNGKPNEFNVKKKTFLQQFPTAFQTKSSSIHLTHLFFLAAQHSECSNHEKHQTDSAQKSKATDWRKRKRNQFPQRENIKIIYSVRLLKFISDEKFTSVNIHAP